MEDSGLGHRSKDEDGFFMPRSSIVIPKAKQ
jgi:hypothetical protein